MKPWFKDHCYWYVPYSNTLLYTWNRIVCHMFDHVECIVELAVVATAYQKLHIVIIGDFTEVITARGTKHQLYHISIDWNY